MKIVRLSPPLLLILLLLTAMACSKPPQLPPLAADAAIVAFGDSITAGTGAGNAESYPHLLSQLTGRRVINAGIPGELSSAGVQRLTEILERERPALLILCHGGNDLLARQNHQQIAANLRIMITLSKERSIPVLLVAVPSPDITLTPPAIYKELATEFKLPLEEKVLAHILGKGSLKSDYVHPNAAGYRLLAEAVVKLMKRSGSLPN